MLWLADFKRVDDGAYKGDIFITKLYVVPRCFLLVRKRFPVITDLHIADNQRRGLFTASPQLFRCRLRCRDVAVFLCMDLAGRFRFRCKKRIGISDE